MTRRRSSAPRRWAIAALALVAVCVAGLAAANAAQLTVTNARPVVQTTARCSNGPIATTPNTVLSGTTYSRVSLAGLTGCNTLAVAITLFGATGNIVATGSGTAGANPLVITTAATYDAATVTGVALLVGGWGVPTTWTGPAAPVAVSCVSLKSNGQQVGTPCTATVLPATTSWTANGYTYAVVQFTISTTQASFEASVTFSGFAPVRVNGNGSAIRSLFPTPAYSCASLPALRLGPGAPYSGVGTSYYFEATNDPAGMNGNTVRICPP